MDSYHPLGRLERALHWSFACGRVSGIEIRVYGTAVFVLAFTFWQMARLPHVSIGTAAAFTALSVGSLYLVVLVHELGHAFMGRRFQVPTHRITLSAFGGLAHMSAPAPNPRAEAFISLAGPATHLGWIALAWPMSQLVPTVPLAGVPMDVFTYFLLLNLALFGFNLLPVFPMDGGRVLRALLCRRLHPNLATIWACRVGIVGNIAIAAYGLSQPGLGGSIGFFIGLNGAMVCMREMVAARFSEGPYAASDFAPWAPDPDAWKTASRAVPRDEGLRHRGLHRLPGGLTPGVGRRDDGTGPADAPSPQSATATATAEAPPDEETLDRLLARVSEVGLAGLSEDERATLTRISQARRNRR